MHSAVMQNKKYIKFADEHTVEVIALQRLDEGREKGDRRAAGYKTKDENGNEVEYLVEFPNLTLEEMIALNRSKAGTYNKTGKIPYTALVDPHTEKEITKWSGGQSAKTIIEAAKDAIKTLVKEHGKGIERRTIRGIDAAAAKSRGLTEKGNYAKALKALGKIKTQDLPEALQARVKSARDAVIEAAKTRLAEIEKMEATEAKRALGRVMRKLKGTGLEESARAMLDSLKAS